MQKTFAKVNLLLNPTRLRYPWIIGGALWAAWLLSLLLGKGNTDLNGHLVGTDFAAFYTAGKIMWMGQSNDLYGLELAHTIQQALYPETSQNFYPYLNPPHYALWMAPFALIPYPWAPLIWIGLGMVCLWLSLHWLGVRQPARTFFLVLTWLPVFYAASFGQNTFFSLAIFSLTFFLWKRQHSLAAGLVLSLLCYKPQFLAAVGLLWLLDWRANWKALLGLAAGCLAHLGLNLWLLPEASLAYLTFAQKINANLMNVEGFPMWNAISTQAFWLALLPGIKTVAQVLYLACALGSLFYFISFWKKAGKSPAILFSAAIIWLVLALPYLMIYDWTLLLIPAILLYEAAPQLQPQWRATYAILWLVSFLSSALTFGMLSLLPFAIQISIPVLWIAVILAYRSLLQPGTAARSNP